MQSFGEFQLLIAEDSTLVRERLVALAREYLPAHAICSVATATDALAVFERSNPDAVLLDVGLPDMSGLEVLEHIRRRGTSTEVIIFTNWASPEMAARCHLLGADHFVSKAHDVGPVIQILKTITAPAREPALVGTEPASVPAGESALDHRPAGSHPIAVLLVEDDNAQADPLLKLLRPKLPQGSSVTQAASQAQALEWIRDARFDVALLDLGLPDSEGVEAVTALRTASPDVAIIVLSAREDDGTIEAALQAGADDYFIKGELAPAAVARAVIAVAKRKRTARALTVALASRQRIMDSSADVICTLDLAGRFVEVGAACERLWGYTRKELIGRLSTQWIAIEERSESNRFFEAVRGGAAAGEFENCFVRKDGALAEMRWTAVWSATDRLMYCVARDVTRQRQTEEMLRATVESALDCIISVDETYAVIEFNPAAEQTFGWSRAEALGRSLTELIIPPAFQDGHARVMATLLEPGASQWLGRRIEIMAMNRDGSEFPVEWSLVRVGTAEPARYTAFLRGITERVSAREKLKAQEEQYRVLFESNPNAMWVYDLQSLRILAANKAASEQYGYSQEEFLQLTLLALRPPEDSEKVMGAISAEGASARHAGTWRHLRKDGSLLLVDVYSSPTTYEGAPARMAVLLNVTEQKRAEEALRASEERFSSAFEFAPMGIAIVGTDGRWLKANEALCDLLGYSRAELIGRHFQEFTHADSRAADVGQMRRLLCGETRFYHTEKRYLHKAGKDVWVSLGVSLVRDGEGRPLHFISQIQDISARKEAETALRAAEEKYRSIFDNASEGIFQTTLEGAFVSANPALARMVGFGSPEELIRERWDVEHQGYADPDRRQEFKRLMEKHGSVNNFESEVKCKNGSIICLSENTRVVRDPSGDPLYYEGSVRDVSESKRVARELEELNKQLLETSRHAGMAEVATNVLHNVGNVLNSVNVSCAMIAEKVRHSRIGTVAKAAELVRKHSDDLAAFFATNPAGQKLPDFLGKLAERLAREQVAMLEEVHSLSQNIAHIKEIIAVQQSYANVRGLHETLPIAGLIEDALRINGESLHRHHVRIVQDFTDLPPTSLDKHKVLQILVNLVRNAKHALVDSGRADKRLTMRIIRRDDTRFAVSVSDNGIGIEPQNITRVFAHGFTTKKNGHGFGLHSGVLAAQEMGGSLTVQSDGPGRGATFTLELPCDGGGSTK